ncbi:MAG: MtrAB system histidine kinase MtrB [Streptosporangiaceae bacterium]
MSVPVRRGTSRLVGRLDWLPWSGLRAAARTGTAGGRLFRGLQRRWRGSLQLRVVSTTLVVSAVVISMLGLFLMQQIASKMLHNAEVQAFTQATNGLARAEAQPSASLPPGPVAKAQMSQVVGSLGPSLQNLGPEYGVAIAVQRDPSTAATWLAAELNTTTDDLPAKLRPAAIKRTAHASLSFAQLPYPGPTGPPTTGLLFAAPFGSSYDLYYFFPLNQLQNELTWIQRTLVLVGLALVFLLAGIAWMVTRWVVKPVARAAQGAQLLSTGKLDERLAVRGDDEIAALATSFNEMAASLQEKMQELEELSQVQRLFVSDVSHELRTPLTTIRMAADLLFESREQLESAAARSAELLQSQIGRFESLLADLLEISRHDANAATLDSELNDVSDVVRQSADVAQQLAERRGCRIEFRLPAEPCLAEVDRRRVERILRNLLCNAVEHGEGRDVIVTSAADRDAVAIAVRDFGVGLRPGEEHLVFDRFWRADPARARTTGGTGLGLSIALEDARLHGGWLEAWGSPARGSVFRLTLPRVAGTTLAGSPLPLVPDGADVDNLTVPGPGELIPPAVAPAGRAAPAGNGARAPTGTSARNPAASAGQDGKR